MANLTIQVLNATGIRGQKGEHVNSFVRAQFADFDYKDSPVMNDTPSPSYNLTLEQSLVVNPQLIDLFLNKKLSLVIIESLPKEKTAILGTAEVSLSSLVSQPSLKQTVTIQYTNPKLLNGVAECTISASVSEPLLDEETLNNGVFLTAHLTQASPLPEVWNMKESNEKDLNSNIYNYNLDILLEPQHSLTIPNGELGQKDVAPYDPFIHNPQAIYADNNEGKAEGEKVATNCIIWDKEVRTFLTPQAIDSLCHTKTIYFELSRIVNSKYNAVDTFNKGQVSIDLTPLLVPTVTGYKGRFVITDAEGVYTHAKTNVEVTLTFSRPLIDKKRLLSVATSIRDFIPQRATVNIEKRALDAESNLKKKMTDIIKSLAAEFQQSMNGQVVDPERRKKLFLFHLTKSGAYFTLKEQLKSSVVGIVREKFQQKSPFTNADETQLFMSQVYVYLVEQLHAVINSTYGEIDISRDELKALGAFAALAESEAQFEIAQKYHLERVSKFEESISVWYDYATFQLRTQPEKGVEVLREIISRSDSHIPSLIAYGMMMCSDKKYEESKTFLQTAVQLAPENVVAKTALGVWFEINNYEKEAQKYYSGEWLSTAEFAIQINNTEFTDRVLAKELAQRTTIKPFLLYHTLAIQQRNYEVAYSNLKKAISVDEKETRVWVALGHLEYLRANYAEARRAYEKALTLEALEPKEMSLLYSRLGAIHQRQASSLSSREALGKSSDEINETYAELAKDMYLKASTLAPSSSTWLGVGKAAFSMKQYQDAEDAFAQANILNNRDSNVWAHLALLNLTLGRMTEADQCLAQALRLGVKDPQILSQVGRGFLDAKQNAAAAECIRMAVEMEPNNEALQKLFTQIIA